MAACGQRRGDERKRREEKKGGDPNSNSQRVRKTKGKKETHNHRTVGRKANLSMGGWLPVGRRGGSDRKRREAETSANSVCG